MHADVQFSLIFVDLSQEVGHDVNSYLDVQFSLIFVDLSLEVGLDVNS